jgi:secreted trypsin-like serine protease
MGRMRMVVGIAVLTSVLLVATPAGAITFGELDGELHPNVGAVVVEVDTDEYFAVCSGTLIAPDVFLTAAHCVSEGERLWVSFDTTFDQDSTRLAGTAHPHPLFASGGQNNTYDIAVIELDEPVSHIQPADLPQAGLLDTLKANHTLRDRTFIAVGYGTVRDMKEGGPHGLLPNADRRYALQSANALRKSWLQLSMQPSTGDGGTCYGDSGGPHFLGDETSNLVVSITVTGDAMCRATDTTYRLDTPSARTFLADYLTLT